MDICVSYSEWVRCGEMSVNENVEKRAKQVKNIVTFRTVPVTHLPQKWFAQQTQNEAFKTWPIRPIARHRYAEAWVGHLRSEKFRSALSDAARSPERLPKGCLSAASRFSRNRMAVLCPEPPNVKQDLAECARMTDSLTDFLFIIANWSEFELECH